MKFFPRGELYLIEDSRTSLLSSRVYEITEEESLTFASLKSLIADLLMKDPSYIINKDEIEVRGEKTPPGDLEKAADYKFITCKVYVKKK